MIKERVFNKNTDNYIAWFRFYKLTVAKWNILPVVWKGRRVYEAKRTAHWCVKTCDYSYLTV